MRKLTKTFCCIFVFLICIMTFSGCSNKSPSTGDILDVYKNNGYFEIDTSPYLDIKCNKNNTVTISNTTLYKNHSIIYVTLANDNLQNDNFSSEFVNLHNNTLLSGFNIDGKFIETKAINNYSFKISHDTVASAVIENVNVLGTSVYTISSYNHNTLKFLSDPDYLAKVLSFSANKFSSSDNFLFFNFNGQSNTNSNVFKSALENDFADIHYSFEIPVETEIVYFFLTVETESHKLIHIQLNSTNVDENAYSKTSIAINNSSTKTRNIVIETSNDLTTLDHYKK